MINPSVEIGRPANGEIVLVLRGPSDEMYEALENAEYTSVNLCDGKRKWGSLDFLLDYKDKITSISLSETKNLAPISQLTKLTKLVLGSEAALDYSQLKQLRKLYIYMSRKQDESIGSLPNLVRLTVHGWKPQDCKFLSGLGNLRTLDFIDGRNLLTLDGLGNLPRLESVFFTCMSRLEDCSALSTVPNLKELVIEGCKKVHDVSFLSDLKELLYFGADVDIPSFSLLSGLPNLKHINFTGKVLDGDVEILKSFPELRICIFNNRRGQNLKFEEISSFLDNKWGIPNLWKKRAVDIYGFETAK